MQRALAILNNVTWCQRVVAAHGVPSEIREHCWVAEGAVPPYYSNLVTRTAEAGHAEQLEHLGRLAASPAKPRWSMKDSFARFDVSELGPLGLSVLFEARWFGLPPTSGAAAAGETGVRWIAIQNERDLASWEAAWQISSPAPGLRVFPPALLADPTITFLGALVGTERYGGAIANASEGVIGLSNVFTLEGPVPGAFLRDCARTVGALQPERPVVGYGPVTELQELTPLGAEDLGPLRVWVTAPPADASA